MPSCNHERNALGFPRHFKQGGDNEWKTGFGCGEMLGGSLGIGSAAGWAMHGVIGLLLGIICAYRAAARFPGAPSIRGAAYGILVFLLAQLMVMPMMGAGVFSGGRLLVIGGSLMGHLVYGIVLGAVYGRSLPLRAA